MIELPEKYVNKLDQGIRGINTIGRKYRAFKFYIPQKQKDEIKRIIDHLGKIKRAYTFMLECIYDLDHNESPEVLDIDFTFEQVYLEIEKADEILNEARLKKLNYDNTRNEFIQYSRDSH